MAVNRIEQYFESQEEELPYFGGCPECGKTDGYVNLVSNHWFVCDAHKTKWCAGAGLFSDWREETQDVWESNARKLEGYREVKPSR